MYAVLGHCRHRLEAEDNDALFGLVRRHLIRAHLAAAPTEEQIKEIVLVHTTSSTPRCITAAMRKGFARTPTDVHTSAHRKATP